MLSIPIKIPGISKLSHVNRRLLSGASWSVGGVVLERFFLLLLSLVIARTLEQNEFGQYSLIQSTLSAFAVLSTLGIGVTATKKTAELKFNQPLLLSEVLKFLSRLFYLLTGLVCALMLLFAESIVTHILNMSELKYQFSGAILALIFNVLHGFQIGCLTGFERIKDISKSIVITACVSLPLTALLVLTHGLNGAILGLVLTSLSRFILSQYYLRRAYRDFLVKIAKAPLIPRWDLIKGLALPAFLSGLFLLPVHWVCHSMLANTDQGASEMAILGVANQWFYALIFLPVAANRILLPVLTQAFTSPENKVDFKPVILKSMLGNFLVTFPVVIGLIFFSAEIMSLYGTAYESESETLVLILLAGGLNALCMPLGQVFTAADKAWAGTFVNLVWALTYLGFTLLLLEHGAYGVAGALLIAYLLHFMLSSVASYWVYRYSGARIS